MSNDDAPLYPELSARCEDARSELLKHMAERGLFERDGWRVYEFTRDAGGGTELVMRPVHTRFDTPDDLECVCRIEEASRRVSADCQNGG